MKIKKWTKHDKGTLKAFFDIELPSLGMCIRDFKYHIKGGGRWVGYPSREYEKADGTQGWSNTIYFDDRDDHYGFQQDLLDLIDAHLNESAVPEPGSFEPDEPEQEEIPF